MRNGDWLVWAAIIAFACIVAFGFLALGGAFGPSR